jgi:hypothetical protein
MAMLRTFMPEIERKVNFVSIGFLVLCARAGSHDRPDRLTDVGANHEPWIFGD